jgi:hypothetical protein
MSEEVSEHRRRRRRKHRRHRQLTTKKKWIIGVSIFAGLLVVAGLLSMGSSALSDMKKQNEKVAANQYVGFGRQTVILMNPSEQDWGYTTVTINDQYVAHAPEIPKGMQFEIFRDKFQGTNGFFSITNKIDSVKIEPQGQKPIYWSPGLE